MIKHTKSIFRSFVELDPSLLRQMWILSWPVMLSNLLHAMVPLIDTIMVGRLGPESIASIGLGNLLRMFLFILVLSVAVGSISLMSQAKGARDKKRMSDVTKQSIISGLMVSVVLGLLGLLISKPVLSLMDSSDNAGMVNDAYDYLVVIYIGAPFLLLNFVFNRLMQGAGDTKTPLILTIFTVLINIILNYLFIFGWWFIPPMEIVGAAIGSVGTRAFMAFVAFYILYSGRNVIKIIDNDWRPKWRLIKDLFTIGIPSGVQGIFRRGSNMFLIGIVTATELGGLGAAVLAIGWQIESVLAQIIVGINVAGTSIVGQEIGKWQTLAAFRKGNTLLLFGSLFAVLMIIPALLYADELVLLFDPSANQTIVTGTKDFLYIVFSSLPIASVSILIAGTMRGASDTTPAMISTLMFRTVFTIVLAYLLVFYWDYGSLGVWLAMVAGRWLDVSYMLHQWISRKWLHTALNKTELFRRHLKGLSSRKATDFLTQIKASQMNIPNTVEIVTSNGVIYKRGEEEEFYSLIESNDQDPLI